MPEENAVAEQVGGASSVKDGDGGNAPKENGLKPEETTASAPAGAPSPSSFQAAQQVGNEMQWHLRNQPLLPQIPFPLPPPPWSQGFIQTLANATNVAAFLNHYSNGNRPAPPQLFGLNTTSGTAQAAASILSPLLFGPQFLQQNQKGNSRSQPFSNFQTPLTTQSFSNSNGKPSQPQRKQTSDFSKMNGTVNPGSPVVTSTPKSPNTNPSIPQSRQSSNISTPTKHSKEPKSIPAVPPKARYIPRNADGFVPKSSIPAEFTLKEYAQQCINAAHASRLHPDILHHEEYLLLRKHITTNQVTNYLNIRNGILRLWHKNPLVSVTRDEACGCARDIRFFQLANFAYDWLVRNGYINHGCAEVPSTAPPSEETSEMPIKRKRKTIAVIGAGMSGLGCARQLEGLISQMGELLEPGEEPPQVIVLEARNRIGGRVYSHPIKDQSRSTLPEGKRATADLGASIITGFEHGNPMSVLIRSQLGIPFYSLTDRSLLYDIDGKPADQERDRMVENLYNDILDRCAIFKQHNQRQKSVSGDKDLIEAGKDAPYEGLRTIAESEGTERPPPPLVFEPDPNSAPFSASVNKLTGKPLTATKSSAVIPAAEQVQILGWKVKPGVTPKRTIDLKPKSKEKGLSPCLGKTMDYALEQYQRLIELTPLDFRLLNWHYANMEYANATNLDELSLGQWDQDDGNEFKGPHSMIIGGYTQVPRGLWHAPKKLDIRFNSPVKKIKYGGQGVRIECADDSKYEVDHVVITIPLGVLKSGDVEFEPALPEWKSGAIKRLGFGILNKVVLVYKEAFWDEENDFAGTLRKPEGDEMLQSSYVTSRGRFYMFWNTMKISGVPMLVALMAGEAAEKTEHEPDSILIEEATSVLANMYPDVSIPVPVETIITRWRSDPYARGSYSYVGSEATGEDYNQMAAPIDGKLFFAGEATCGTHPATVHGAYISGLRAASELSNYLFGPIHIPTPLITPKAKSSTTPSGNSTPVKRKNSDDSALSKLRELREKRNEAYAARYTEALKAELGERPQKPGRSAANPFLLYQKDKWFICKAKCDKEAQERAGSSDAKASRNEVRAALGLMWRESSEEEKRPYIAATQNNKKANSDAVEEFKKTVLEWDKKEAEFKERWEKENPNEPGPEEQEIIDKAELDKREAKRVRRIGGYAELSSDE